MKLAMLPTGFHSSALPCPLHYGGHTGILRRLQPGDESRLVNFFISHTEETLRQRYGYYPSPMTPDRAGPLVGVDQGKDAALGIFEKFRGSPRLVAVGRYCLSPGEQSAELAFVVLEDRRRLGLASTLLHALTAIARERGLTQLVAQTSSDNHAMLGLFRQRGAKLRTIPNANAFAVTIPLGSAPKPAERRKLARPVTLAARRARSILPPESSATA